MDLFSNMTDDQFALVGCVIALIVTGGLMSFSHHIGNARRKVGEPRRFSYEEHAAQQRDRQENIRKAA